ncbi:MAG: tripartite tricarboxylate transporter substrate binding protein, partial [Betaproteobacteria bacterium]|nr:tripartite tricarboxylate transporter substrate binding protein [Betaproteobacteria bacterium]
AFHVAVEYFNRQAGVKIVHVPYKGAAPALTAAVSGEATMIVLSIPPLRPHLTSGKLRAVAITGAKRSRFFPDLPTVLESGLEFEGVSWAGLFAPAGTPPAIIDRIYGAMSGAIKDNAMQERLTAMGRDTSTIGIPPAEFEVLFRKELAKWPKAIRELGIRGG